MEVLTLNDCFLKSDGDKKATVKISRDGIAIKAGDGEVYTVERNEVKDAELFYGVRKMAIRVFGNAVYEINNVDQNYIDELKRIFSEYFRITLYVKELEIADVLCGELGINGQKALEFRNTKTIFEIPVDDIESVVDIRNELSVSLRDMEIRFVSDRKTIEEIKGGCSSSVDDEILKMEGLSLAYPRGKFNFIFFRDYLRLVGSSYDHKIYYKSIKMLYVLEKGYIRDGERYVVIGADPPIRQGQTRYDHVVVAFDDVERELSVSDERLKGEYSGLLSEIFAEVMEALCVIKAVRSSFESRDGMRCLRCAMKAYEGQLYPLDDCMLFLPKAVRLDLGEISLVEFSRINLSSMQAKTFDMTLFCEGPYTFNGLSKDEFGALEQYFHGKGIKARSEVIDDGAISDSEEDEYESENDSMVVDSDEYDLQ
ncbi:STRUCTURE-SPECIFIC RECOGNITION PROTEIN [Encephalitozoon cuniculi GB-M1]|uniref:FACT complex subunit POB3 n=2 Tax=Encephalitozoon cuniculi TaxID=6035 RepID=Q8SRJ1_ENCCU|nr:FACT complex subunit POB3 [Encephalitozoon cuniculi GB-M1]AGE95804.1 structure-specific recognition protein [Encephalitozoon cuniculi]KMV65826.1 nucleosome-binding factor SPN subunit POB3 [Encephalitozoon cuniculi EcunIII-L]UYI27264.1 FACT complex subunit pob3 [Encephalitozoon cuniculi]CAD25634.1 STRUCTURE-SPECIFIC RECOGNITION PROTEIN [Encephalitozoon cuniculi GB-M1]